MAVQLQQLHLCVHLQLTIAFRLIQYVLVTAASVVLVVLVVTTRCSHSVLQLVGQPQMVVAVMATSRFLQMYQPEPLQVQQGVEADTVMHILQLHLALWERQEMAVAVEVRPGLVSPLSPRSLLRMLQLEEEEEQEVVVDLLWVRLQDLQAAVSAALVVVLVVMLELVRLVKVPLLPHRHPREDQLQQPLQQQRPLQLQLQPPPPPPPVLELTVLMVLQQLPMECMGDSRSPRGPIIRTRMLQLQPLLRRRLHTIPMRQCLVWRMALLLVQQQLLPQLPLQLPPRPLQLVVEQEQVDHAQEEPVVLVVQTWAQQQVPLLKMAVEKMVLLLLPPRVRKVRTPTIYLLLVAFLHVDSGSVLHPTAVV
jgi:hypothetical protein